jgi:DNA polymerase-3 subunit beta
VGAKIEKEGTLSVPAKFLTEFVSSLPPEKIELEVQGNSLFISSGGYKANFVGLSSSEFPPVPTLKDKETIVFSSGDLARAISQVTFAAAQDEGRPQLTGVLLIIKADDLLMVATDGYRLSLKKLAGIKGIKDIKEFKKGLIIPSRTLIEIGRIINEREQSSEVGLAITPDSNQIIFSTNEAEIVSRLIEGAFPDFEKIIPEKGKTKIICETETLIRAVRMASIFARESANIIKLKTQNSKLKISANATQVGENTSEIEAKSEGEENKIAFNSRYLLDFLNSVETEQVAFEMTNPLNPGVFKPVGDQSFLHIIMPVRVQE